MAQDNKNRINFGMSIEDEDPSGSSSSIPQEVENTNPNGEPTIHIEEYGGEPDFNANRARQTMDSIGSEGYRPDQSQMSPTYRDAQRPGTNQGRPMPSQPGGRRGGAPSLPGKNGLQDPNGNRGGLDNGEQGGGVETTPAPNKNETAPDMGKDYGSSNPPKGPAGQPEAKNAAAEAGSGNPAGPVPAPPVDAAKGRDATQDDINKHPSDVDNEMPKKDGVGDQSEAQKKGLEDNPEGKKDGLEKPEDKNPLEDGEKKPGEEGEKKPEGEGKEKADNPEAKGGKNAPISEENANKPKPQQPAGNGYGALNNRGGQQGPTQGQGQNGDVTRNARQNMNRTSGTGEGKKKAAGAKKGSTGSINTPVKPSLASRAGSFLKNKLIGKNEGGERNTEHRATIAGTGISRQWMGVAKNWLLTHPMALMALIVGGMILLIALTSGDGGGGNWNGTPSTSGGQCFYSLKGVISTGTVNLDGLQVEIINCDGKKDNYHVIETVDFEKYVVGVALAEVSWHADHPEYLQAQIIAARGFALRRNSSMCPSNPDNCFFGYNPSTGKIRLRNCSNDQNYCDYDRPCYRKEREGQKALTGLEAEQEGPTRLWKNQLDENTKAAVLQAAEVVKGKVLLDTSGNVVYTNYVNTDQQQWWALAQQGMDVEQILKTHYASQNAAGLSSANCSTVGNINYGDYVLSSDGHEILHQPLDQFLQSKGTSLDAFNSLIQSNVRTAGYGTRAGVVAAAVTLIGELGNKYNVKVPYYWGGGHGDGVAEGALAKWGSNSCHTTANGQSYDYCGLDCSGFVPWAIKNGGFDIGTNLASNFQYLDGAQKVSLSSTQAVLQPGDLLESSHHVVLVIGVEESSGNYICAEAAGNAKGVLFTRRAFGGNGEYWGVNMDGYYSKHARSSS